MNINIYIYKSSFRTYIECGVFIRTYIQNLLSKYFLFKINKNINILTYILIVLLEDLIKKNYNKSVEPIKSNLKSFLFLGLNGQPQPEILFEDIGSTTAALLGTLGYE